MTVLALIEENFLDQEVKTVIVITEIVLLPILIHLIPFSGIRPLGAVLLPMFISPMVGVFFICGTCICWLVPGSRRWRGLSEGQMKGVARSS